MKFSLREILGLSAFIAISLASMRMGGVLAGAMIVGICLLATALLIVAFVVRDIRRAWAIGFLVPFLAYAAVHYASGRHALNPYSIEALPTTRSFQPIHEAISTMIWVDYYTGEVVPDYDPEADPSRHLGGSFISGGPVNGAVMTQVLPDKAEFSLVAHTFIAVLLGIVGAKFSVYLYHSQEETG